MTTHPPRPADEWEKCKTCGGTGMVADGCYPDGDVIYWPCHSCSPRPDDGKEGKCGECGKEKCTCACTPLAGKNLHVHAAKFCHGHPAAPEGKDDCDTERPMTEGEAALSEDFNKFISAPDADAGGWRERFDKKAKITKWVGSEFHDCDATESGLEYRADMEKIKAFIQQELNALIDEAVRAIEGTGWDESGKGDWLMTREQAIAALNSLRQRT